MNNKIKIAIVIIVIALVLSISYMFLSMEKNNEHHMVNVTKNVTNNTTIVEQDYSKSNGQVDYGGDVSGSEPMDADTEWYLDERPHQRMHSMDEVPSGEREVHYTEDGSGWYEYFD